MYKAFPIAQASQFDEFIRFVFTRQKRARDIKSRTIWRIYLIFFTRQKHAYQNHEKVVKTHAALLSTASTIFKHFVFTRQKRALAPSNLWKTCENARLWPKFEVI